MRALLSAALLLALAPASASASSLHMETPAEALQDTAVRVRLTGVADQPARLRMWWLDARSDPGCGRRPFGRALDQQVLGAFDHVVTVNAGYLGHLSLCSALDDAVAARVITVRRPRAELLVGRVPSVRPRRPFTLRVSGFSERPSQLLVVPSTFDCRIVREEDGRGIPVVGPFALNPRLSVPSAYDDELCVVLIPEGETTPIAHQEVRVEVRTPCDEARSRRWRILRSRRGAKDRLRLFNADAQVKRLCG